jgi:hypothetical protein
MRPGVAVSPVPMSFPYHLCLNHFPLFRELHGISRQIDQDLPDSQRVSHHKLWDDNVNIG